MYLIKRYANGRYYDTVAKNYITRDRIAELVGAGEKISIMETRTGEDITDRILAQFAERESGSGEASDSGPSRDTVETVLAQLLKKGETVFDEGRRRLESIREGLGAGPREEVDRFLSTLRRKKSELEALDTRGLKDEVDRYRKHFNEWISGSVDKRVDETLRKMNLADRDQIRELNRSVERLSRRIEKLEQELADKDRSV